MSNVLERYAQPVQNDAESQQLQFRKRNASGAARCQVRIKGVTDHDAQENSQRQRTDTLRLQPGIVREGNCQVGECPGQQHARQVGYRGVCMPMPLMLGCSGRGQWVLRGGLLAVCV